MLQEEEPPQLIGQSLDLGSEEPAAMARDAQDRLEKDTGDGFHAPQSEINTPSLPSPSHRRSQLYAFAACMLLLLLFIGAERIREYYTQGKIIYSSSVPEVSNSTAPPVQNQTMIMNEIQPIASPTPSSAAPTAPANPLASVTAWAYLVGNAKTGQVYLSRNAAEVLPIASLSKLTTALVARQFMNQSQIVPITQQVMDVYSDAYGIELGESFSVSELYYPLLLQSNDNVAEALAYAYGNIATDSPVQAQADPSASVEATSTDTAFVQKMNDYAGELGMEHSHFLDASGLSEGNVSTASDLFILAQFLYADKFSDNSLTPNLLAITTQASESVSTTTEHFAHDFLNINPFAGDPNFVGGKTGRTNAAGETMISIFNYQSGSETDPIVVIALHSDYGTRQADTEKLLADVEAGIAAGKY